MNCKEIMEEWPAIKEASNSTIVLKEDKKGAKKIGITFSNSSKGNYVTLKLDEALPQEAGKKACDFLLVTCPSGEPLLV